MLTDYGVATTCRLLKIIGLSYKRDYILQKRPIILRILLTIATPYPWIQVCFRMAKTHGIFYLYTSFSAKSPILSGFFVERGLQPMHFRCPVGFYSILMNEDSLF